MGEQVCLDIEMPEVIISDIDPFLGRVLWIMPDTIFIDDDLSGDLKSSVLVHEMAHIIDAKMAGPIIYTEIGSCVSESNAFFIESLWRKSKGLEYDEEGWAWLEQEYYKPCAKYFTRVKTEE